MQELIEEHGYFSKAKLYDQYSVTNAIQTCFNEIIEFVSGRPAPQFRHESS
jgi:hypothetical protein